MRRAVAIALLLLVLGGAGGAQEWEFINDLPAGADQFVADPAHGRLLLGASRGYQVYHPGSTIWIDRLLEQGSVSKVLSFLPSADDSLALLTGRQMMFGDYGYIMDNQGLSAWGSILDLGLGHPVGGVTGLGRLPGNQATLLACTRSPFGGVLRSLDGGTSWSRMEILSCGNDLAVTPDGDVLVAYGDGIGGQNGILRSTDGGETWVEVSGDMPRVSLIGAIAVDPLDSQHLYTKQLDWDFGGTDPALGIYESLDGGLHWEQILQGNYEDLSMHPFDANILVALRDQAIMLTTDGGDTWQDITGDLPGVWTGDQCVVCPTDERIYFGGYYPGLWARETFPTTVGGAPSAALHLSAHPNPFNPSTRITFGLPAAGPVSLSILDVQGRVVRHLLEGEARAAGSQTVAWDGRDGLGRSLPSGLYFARLEVGGQRAVSKLLLLQ